MVGFHHLLRRLAAGLALAVLAACGSSTSPETPVVATDPLPEPDPRIQKFIVKDPQVSAAFLDVEDLNGDGIQEIVLSTLVEQNAGPPNASTRGALRIFESSTGTLEGPWDENIIISVTDAQNQGEGWPFINTPQVFDADGDGIRDIVVQTGFLLTNGGAHFVMRGTANDNLEFPHSNRVYFDNSTRKEFSDNYYWHETEQVDLDEDGLLDLVTTSAQTQRIPQNPLGSPVCDEAQQPNNRCAELKVEWYRNTGTTDLAGAPVFEYFQIAPELQFGGVFIKMHDIDGDGDQDIALTQFFGPPQIPSIVWLENVEAPAADNAFQGVWALHEIDSSIGLGYHMEFADLNGDGNIDLVVGNHNNQDDPRMVDGDGNTILPGMFWFEIPDDPAADEPWTKHVISEDFRVTIDYGSSPHSQGVPGIFNVGDINMDGRLDIAVPGDGNSLLYAFLQNADGSFEEIIVDTGKTFGMAIVTDVDGDGHNEIVAANHNALDGEQRVDFPPGFLAIYRFPAAEP